MNFEIVPLTSEQYAEWDAFCLKSADAWFWHTTDWLEYTLNYKPELKTENLSFLVRRGGAVKAIVPLTMETYDSKNGIREFSFGSGAIPAPAFDDAGRVEKDRLEKDVVADLVFQEIDRCAKEHGVARAWMKMTPLSPRCSSEAAIFNQLLRFGYSDVSLNTQLIDLKKSEEELRAAMRRNHIRNIRKGNHFEFTVYTSATITRELFNLYKETHHKDAGRKTRPDRTFELMYDWISRDLGFLGIVWVDKKPSSFLYYLAYKNNVYGASAARDPKFASLPLRHILEWEAIRWMRQRGFGLYEVGLQQFGPLLHDIPDKKQLDIAHFKRGFGGVTVPWFIAEKYYDKNYFLKTYEARMRRFADLL